MVNLKRVLLLENINPLESFRPGYIKENKTEQWISLMLKDINILFTVGGTSYKCRHTPTNTIQP